MNKQKRSEQVHGKKERKYGKNCIQNRTKLIHTLWKKTKNIRHHMHYTLSNFLLDNFQKILLPTFKTGEMVQKDVRPFGRKTARDMLTWSHYEFQQRLIWKATRRGRDRDVYLVDESYTSKTCGVCGKINNKLGGSKTFHCGKCNLTIDQDMHAARNILIKNMGFCDIALKEINHI